MNPKDFVGAQCWNSLNQGGVITDVENKEFVVRQKTGMFSNMVTRVADSVSRMLPLVKKERIVTEIGKRVAKQYPVRERLYLRMAAAGIIQYKTDREGQLFRDVIIPITRQNIIDFCGGSDSISVRKDIGKIETDLNRPGFRKLFCDLIIQEDIERCRSESLSPDETLNKKVEEYLGENITTTLVNHSRSVDSEQMLQSLRKNKDYPSVTERGIRNLDLLMLRLFMVRAGLIPAVEMEYAWQHFINEINTIKMWDFRESLWGGGYGMGNKSSDKLQKVINKSISHRAEIPTSMPGGIVRAKLINDLIYCQIPDKQSHVFFAAKAPENINLYRPEMEQADKAPGLVNRGNLCYYNSVIKMLANQVSIEALNRSLEGVSANSDMGTTGAVENQMLREKLINLLAAIKYFRAGYFCSEWVDEKSAEFFQQLQLRCQQDDVNKQFSDNRQNDVHELIQLLDKILGYSEKPEYSFRVTSQFKVTIGERFHGFKYKEDSSRETIITPNLKRGEAAGYMECLNDFFQEEVIDDFLWGSEHAEEF
nr:hypothetical protein [Endozoicomonas sp.]